MSDESAVLGKRASFAPAFGSGCWRHPRIVFGFAFEMNKLGSGVK